MCLVVKTTCKNFKKEPKMQQRFETFTVLISGINRNIRRIKAEEMEEFDLKSHHVSCIYYLYMQDGLTARELCDLCEEDKANISRALEYLEKQGYISRDAAHKRYRSPLSLTEKGREIGRRLADKIDKMLTAASEGLDEQDREIMYRSLEIISRNLQGICDEYDAARHE